MNLFNKKEKMDRKKKGEEDNKPAYAFADILRGLQNAVSGAQDMLQAYQLHNLSAFWNQDGTPMAQKVKLGDKDVEVPLLTLVPHSQLAMEDVVVKFKTRIGSGDTDVMDVTIRFKTKETPEAVARLMDEYNKLI